MVTLVKLASVMEAELLQGWLNGHGVRVLLPDELGAGAFPPTAMLGGVRVMVDEKDYDQATRLMEEFQRRRDTPTPSELGPAATDDAGPAANDAPAAE